MAGPGKMTVCVTAAARFSKRAFRAPFSRLPVCFPRCVQINLLAIGTDDFTPSVMKNPKVAVPASICPEI